MSETRKVKTRDGTVLHTELWEPDGDVRFVVCIVHGQAEHVSRYDQVAAELNAIGGLVFGPDHRGQGRSGGSPSHVECFEQYTGDLLDVLRDYADHLGPERGPEAVPWFLWGHSMGGLITLTYLLDHEADVPLRGAVVSAPLIGLVVEVGPLKRFAVRALAKILPRLQVPSGLPPETISRDPEQVKAYVEDARRIAPITPGWAVAMEDAIERVQVGVAKVGLAMHWYHGSGDLVCDAEATRELFASLPDPVGNDQSFEMWPGYYHELHNEPPELRKPVIESIHRWLEARL